MLRLVQLFISCAALVLLRPVHWLTGIMAAGTAMFNATFGMACLSMLLVLRSGQRVAEGMQRRVRPALAIW